MKTVWDAINEKVSNRWLRYLLIGLSILMIVVVGVVWTKGVDKVWPDSAPVSVVEPEVKLTACCVNDIDDSYLGERIRKRFLAGKMKNSSDIRLPLRVRRMIAKKVDTPKEESRTWWRKTLNTGACVSNMGGAAPLNSLCITHKQWNNDEQYRFWKKVTKVKLQCGGAAVFGYVNGSWKGAMIGASGCAWTKAVDLW